MLDKVAQSLRSVSGNAFERIVAKILNAFLINEGIVVTRARARALRVLIPDLSNLKAILDYSRIPVKRQCTQGQVEDFPDLDLFALLAPQQPGEKWRLLAILNLKVSFHARATEATFWGLLVRLTSRIPFVVITEDRDIYQQKASELGPSCKEAKRARRLLEAFTDGVYLVKRYKSEKDPSLDRDIRRKKEVIGTQHNIIVFDDPNIPRHTQYCRSVRPLDDLIDDLKRWKMEYMDRGT